MISSNKGQIKLKKNIEDSNNEFSGLLQLHKFFTIPSILGATLTIVYLIRNSFFAAIIPGWLDVLGILSYVLLALSVVMALHYGGGIWICCFSVILAAMPGSVWSAATETTIPKYLGWVLLVMGVGPVFVGKKSKELRDAAWESTIISCIVIGFGSFIWYVFDGPIYGQGLFTGLMNQANTVGPLAGIGSVAGISRALASSGRRRMWWLAFSGLSMVPCVASGSRISVLAMSVGIVMVNMVTTKATLTRLWMILFTCLILGAGGLSYIRNSESYVNLTSIMRDKGEVNTRELLWQARWDEFAANQIWGVGIGYGVYGEGVGVEVDSKGRVKIEPGSSYLAVLSMTGVVGAAAMMLVAAWVLARLLINNKNFPNGKFGEFLGIGTFMCIHGIAEGWIYAVGSFGALIFWLILGRLCDFTEQIIETRPKVMRY